jgi:hypothetical protein
VLPAVTVAVSVTTLPDVTAVTALPPEVTASVVVVAAPVAQAESPPSSKTPRVTSGQQDCPRRPCRGEAQQENEGIEGLLGAISAKISQGETTPIYSAVVLRCGQLVIDYLLGSGQIQRISSF